MYVYIYIYTYIYTYICIHIYCMMYACIHRWAVPGGVRTERRADCELEYLPNLLPIFYVIYYCLIGGQCLVPR